MIENIIEELTKQMEEFKNFILQHRDNPLLWLGMFVLGIVVFKSVYRALQKEK